MQISASRACVAAWASAACLLPAIPAFAADAFVIQDGTAGTVRIEQVTGARISVEQHGSGNIADVRQLAGAVDLVEVTQAGVSNRSTVFQQALPGSRAPNLVAVRQLGSGGSANVEQTASGATAAVYQSDLSFGARASLLQTAIAPLGVIEQGVVWVNASQPDARTELNSVRSGTVVPASTAQASAYLMQTGGSGLAGTIIQSGGAQSASIVQNGSYLEANIVQSGAAHTASIVQAGTGTPASPYRASIMQFGAQPQTFSVTQTVGSSPRVIRVVQQ